MHNETIVFSIFLVFAGAAVLATVALYARQALLVAYIVLGALFGPWGFGFISDAGLIQDMAHIGIIFLLFLLGLNLYPQKLFQLFLESATVTIISFAAFGALGFVVAYLSGFNIFDCIVVGVATTFSSTIIGLKLLPTTVLHHRRMGELMISVLLIQDMFAIIALLVFQGLGVGELPLKNISLLLLGLPVLAIFAYAFNRYILLKLFAKFDRIQEYIFLVTIGWCLGMAQLAQSLGFSYEIGAFIAGVAIATSPIARHIAESLKPVRDFFLVLFFFALGASFNMLSTVHVIVPAVILAALVIGLKPVAFRFLFVKAAETEKLAWEMGVRLGQLSEFSLLMVFLALESKLISADAASLVQLSTIFTFVASTYWIVFRYPTPIAVSDELRRD